MTQNDLADAAQLSTAVVNKLENGARHGARPKTILAIAKALHELAPLDAETIDALSRGSGLSLADMLRSASRERKSRAVLDAVTSIPEIAQEQQMMRAVASLPSPERDMCTAILDFAQSFGNETAMELASLLSKIALRLPAQPVPVRSTDVPNLVTIPGPVRRRPDGNFERQDKHFEIPTKQTEQEQQKPTTRRKEA